MKIRWIIRVEGKVQGVFFRKTAYESAISLGLVGFVRNDLDGSVYIEAEGEEKQVRQLAGWAHEGTERSQVRAVHIELIEPIGDSTFEIVFG